MSKKYMLGVDIGTTNTKAVLFQSDGKFIGRSAIEYPLYTPDPITAEQNPEEIFQAVLTAVKNCIKESGITPDRIQFIAFSSAMHSVIAIDSDGRPLTNSITWADNRSKKWADKLKQEWNGHDIYLRTGTPIHPMSPLAKLIWLREEQQTVYSKAEKFISIKEFVFFKLFGDYLVDYSIASATGLFNLYSLDWDEAALELAGITTEKLSKPVPTTHILRGIKDEYAKEMGINPDMPFIIGASDGVLSNLGVNAIEPGVIALTIGTSGAIRTVTDHPVTDPKGRIFCYILTEKHWVIGGPVNNGGMILRWLRDELASSEVETAKRLGRDPYDILTDIAANVPAGANGLIFHPYLSGERAPLWNANSRGSFFGLGMHHKKEHLIRAVLEGILYNLYTVLLALEELIGIPTRVQATGGFARSELWRQMLADIFNQEVVIPESYESSCLGACVLGLYSLGEINSLDKVKDMVGASHNHTPNSENAAVYRDIMPIYIRLSRILAEEYDAIAQFQQKYI